MFLIKSSTWYVSKNEVVLCLVIGRNWILVALFLAEGNRSWPAVRVWVCECELHIYLLD